jgi:hypothetical protein
VLACVRACVCLAWRVCIDLFCGLQMPLLLRLTCTVHTPTHPHTHTHTHTHTLPQICRQAFRDLESDENWKLAQTLWGVTTHYRHDESDK